jgi:HAMP domain-containing protein
MKPFFNRMRIGERIALGFGLVALLFLLVIWQYHRALTDSFDAQRNLREIYETRKTLAFEIQHSLLQIRQAKQNFLRRRHESDVQALQDSLTELFAKTRELAAVDDESATSATAIEALANDYQHRFEQLTNAWRYKGLDENSGLQGAFRKAAHELESRSTQLQTDNLYLHLIQALSAEKDFELTLQPAQREQTERHLAELERQLAESELDVSIKQELATRIQHYRQAFADYAEQALAKGNTKAGATTLQTAARDIEAILLAYRIPQLKTNILQLRRREKDYLLRLDPGYVSMVERLLENLEGQINAAQVIDNEKGEMQALVQTYRKDFFSLVEQDGLIARLERELGDAEKRINQLVADNLYLANQQATQASAQMLSSTERRTALLRAVVIFASLLGLLFAWLITVHITQPLRRMASVLDRLSYNDPVEPIHALDSGRCEINIMTTAVNTLVQKRQIFVRWWQSAMDELHASAQLRQKSLQHSEISEDSLGAIIEAGERREAELRKLADILRSHATVAVEHAQICRQYARPAQAEASNRVERAGKSILTLLDLFYEGAAGKNAG